MAIKCSETSSSSWRGSEDCARENAVLLKIMDFDPLAVVKIGQCLTREISQIPLRISERGLAWRARISRMGGVVVDAPGEEHIPND